MTQDEFNQTCKDVCPQCKAGIAVRFRDDSKEFVHDKAVGHPGFAHSFCLASNFRLKWQDKLSG